jgi:hypothetical protein
MFLAWMITRGFDVDKAIKMIGKDYNDPHFEWKDKFVKTRYRSSCVVPLCVDNQSLSSSSSSP